MKYTGNIIGFKSSFGSIYNVVTEDSKCYLWKATVAAELLGKMMTIVFNWNGEPFELKLSLLKVDYYTGKIFYKREEWGTVYLWKFSKGEDIILKGDFNEYDYGNTECYVELIPVKTTIKEALN